MLTVKPHYKHSLLWQTTQSGSWLTSFDLKKFYSNTVTYSMSEFLAGITFDMWYWYEDDAWCLSVNHFVNPVTYDIKSATKLE